MKKIILPLLFVCNFMFSQEINFSSYNEFLKKYVSENGTVNYEKIQLNIEELNAILIQFEKNKPSENASKNEKIAYYINTYNAYTLKTVTDNYPIKSIKDIKDVWDKKFIPSGKIKISLGNIEHDILRKMNEPRIHFAINCASFSCPNLSNSAFLSETLEEQLEFAAKSFINDKTKNEISEKKVKISEIFKWFSSDFKKNGNLIDFLNKFSAIKINMKAKVKYFRLQLEFKQLNQ